MQEDYKIGYNRGYREALSFVKNEINSLTKGLEAQHPDPLGNTVQMLADAEITALNLVVSTIEEKEETL